MAFLVDRPMPTACDECPCMYDYIQCTTLKDNAKESLSAVDDYTVRQTWCPIKEIVLCKDCKHGDICTQSWDGAQYVECHAHEEEGYDHELGHPLDWFCADGEKDGEQE